MAARGDFSLVVSAAGRVYSFGWGLYGALGHGDQLSQHTPRLIEVLRGVRVSAVAAGGGHSLALSEGKVYSFGWGDAGRLGHGDAEHTTTPRVIAGLRGVRSIAAGSATSFAVDSAGAVFGWGEGVALGLRLTAMNTVNHLAAPCRINSLVVSQA